VDAKYYYTGNVAEIGLGHERAEVAGDGHGAVEVASDGHGAVEAPTQGHDRVEMFAGGWGQGQVPDQGQRPAQGSGSPAPPSPLSPGYFTGQGPVEMPAERYT
jgi:hypothetical protein